MSVSNESWKQELAEGQLVVTICSMRRVELEKICTEKECGSNFFEKEEEIVININTLTAESENKMVQNIVDKTLRKPCMPIKLI